MNKQRVMARRSFGKVMGAVASLVWLVGVFAAQAWDLTVYVSPGAGGAVNSTTPIYTKTGLTTNQAWQLLAVANTDYQFSGWTSFDDFQYSPGNSTTNFVRIKSTNNTDVALFANFVSTIPIYSLTVTKGPGGLSTSPTGTTTYARGTVKTISATPSNSPPNFFIFDQWTGDIAGIGSAYSNNTTITIDDNKSIQATFKQRFTYTSYEPLGPASGSIGTNIVEGTTYVAQPLQNPAPSPTSGKRYSCIGWTAGYGDIPLTGAGPSYSVLSAASTSSNRWAWTNEFNLSLEADTGYNTVGGTVSGGGTVSLGASNWVVQGATVTMTATARAGYDFLGWEVNSTGSVPPGALTIVMNGPTRVVAQFLAQGADSAWIKWKKDFGLNTASNDGEDGPNGDPDRDGLSNWEEFQLQNTNRNWRVSPINADSDGDGMDDYYERYSIDPTNSASQTPVRDFITAAFDNGSYDLDNGANGNRDEDYRWSTNNGYRMISLPLRNIEEWRGPDGLAPLIYTNVAWGNSLYPFSSDRGKTIKMALPNRPPYNIVNPDTFDQSRGNTSDSDKDTLDDGFEYSWDQWQQDHGGLAEIFEIGVINGVSMTITNTVPAWDGESNMTRVFNPSIPDTGRFGGGPDYDVLYDYLGGTVSANYYDTVREYNAWQPGAFSPNIAAAAHTIRMDSPPAGDPTPRRCSHPFLWDVDQDGLPDGYEVIFNYDPWANRTPGHLYVDGQDNPDDDWMAMDGTNSLALRNNEIYVRDGYDPRVAWAQFYPVANQMPGPGSRRAPTTERYGNVQEMRGPDGVMTIIPVSPGSGVDDATNPFNVDSDGDGIWDGWENYVALNPSDATDAGINPDDDKLTSFAEFQSFVTSSTNRQALIPVADWNNKIFPTDPNVADTDGDAIKDGDEKPLFNGTSAASSTNVVIDDVGNVTTQVFAQGVWNSKCYTGGGLNPTSSDTDADTMPDPYEACYRNAPGLDGTLGDAFADPDSDKVPNYLEYYSASVYHWQYDVWFGHPTNTDYDSGDFYGGANGTPKPWDWSQVLYNPLQGKLGRFGYSGACPNLVDSDEDGMDDYYEVYHGLNPAYGCIDLILSKANNIAFPIGLLSPYVSDPRVEPYVNGSPFMDSDGDGLPNSEEGVTLINPTRSPQYHTDPSPMWITDMAYASSWVNLYYTPGSFWPWSGVLPPPIYAYDFECNEGFDTDNDGYSDREELVASQTDPLSPERPVKRRALYLPPGQDAYARTFPGYAFLADNLRSFTVEAWIRPINPASGTNQVVVERPLAIPIGNPMYSSTVRVNFRLGVDPSGLPYIAYHGEGAEAIFYEAKASTMSRISAGSWTHLSGTYQVPSATDPSQRGILTLYVNGQFAAQTNPDELPSTARFGNGPTVFQFGAPIIIGASDANPDGDMDVTTTTPSPAPYDFFKGWIDEVRIWDGARSQSQVVSGMKLRMKQTDVIASLATTVPMVYHYSFDNLPDPDHTPTAPAGLGFDLTANYIYPGDYTGIGFWATEGSRSMVYAGMGGGDPRYLPWIENTVGHVPKVPPVDIGDPNVLQNVTNGTTVTQTVPFRNTTDPYGFRHITSPAILPEIVEGFIMYDDLLPLAWATSDEDVPLWDNGGVPVLDPFSTLGDGIPDDWKEKYGFDPYDTTVAAGDPDQDGLNNYYEYLCGTDPKAPISGSDNVPDGEQDADGDGLSNIQELQHGTMPNIKDTDDDGLTDWEELSGRVDPLWVRPANSPVPKIQTDPLNPLSPAVQRSVYLNGSSRLIVPPSDKLLSKNWTVESWVNPDTNSMGGVLVSRFVQGFSANEYGINYEVGLTTDSAPAGMLRPYVRYMMMTNGSPRESMVNGLGIGEITNGLHAILIPTGTWSHIVGVCNSESNVLSLYVNGQLASFRTDLIALPPTVYGYGTGHRDDEVTIGASRSTGAVSNGFKGYMDNVRIWSGARTAFEILDRYNAPEGQPQGGVSLPLKAGAISTLGGLSDEVTSLTAGSAARVLVKFSDEATARDVASLTAAGVQVLNYVAPGVRAVKATQQQLAALGGKVTWTGVLKGGNKLSPLLKVGAANNGSRFVLVTFFKDVSETEAVQAVQAVGGIVYNGKYIGGQDLVAQVTDDQLTALAANNAVSWTAPAADFLTSGGPVYRLSAYVVGGADLAPFVNRGNGWDGPGRGSANLTYHFVNYNCNLPQATAKKAVADQLFKWAQYADLTFAETTSAGLPYSMDIDWEIIDGPLGILGMGYYPNDINPESIAGDFLLDAEETWKDGVGGNGIDLQYVALHEEGHCLGMAHSDDPKAIMYPYYDGTRDATLADDDIAGIQNIYGTPAVKSGLVEFRFDDGGHTAQDFTVSNDWKTGWASAATLDGAVFSTNKVATLDKDSDRDGLPDWWEMANGLDPYDAATDPAQTDNMNGASGDPDGDGMPNINEYQAGTDPKLVDSDSDSIPDGQEDSDGDGLSNLDEILIHKTNPGIADTDDDGVSDGDELKPEVVKADGRTITSPVYSMSPLVQRCMVLSGAAVPVPADVVTASNTVDRFALSNWTVEAWVKTTSSNETGSVIVHETALGRTTFDLRLEGNVPRIRFTSAAGQVVDAGGSVAIPAGEWTHLAGTWDGNSHSLALYVNGVRYRAQVSYSPCAVGSGKTSIGGGLHGLVDQVRVWNVARKASEIESLFGRIVNCAWLPEVNSDVDLLVCEYRFDDGGTTAEDFRHLADNRYFMADVVFSTNALEISGMDDSEGDGMPDWWQTMNFPEYDVIARTTGDSGGAVNASALPDGWRGTTTPAGEGGDTSVLQVGGPSKAWIIKDVKLELPANATPWPQWGAPTNIVMGSWWLKLKSTGFQREVAATVYVEGQRIGRFVSYKEFVYGWRIETNSLTPAYIIGQRDADEFQISGFLRYGWNRIAIEIENNSTDLQKKDRGVDAAISDITFVVSFPGLDSKTAYLADLIPLGSKWALYGANESFPGPLGAPNVDFQGREWFDSEYGANPSDLSLREGVSTSGKYNASDDPDGDGLINLFEYYVGANPKDDDTDNDGVLDMFEDSDADGLQNRMEQVVGASPLLVDTDDDGISDGSEAVANTSAANSLRPLVDRVLQTDGLSSSYVEMPRATRFSLADWTLGCWVMPNVRTPALLIGRQVQSGVWNYNLNLNTNGQAVAMFTAGDLGSDVSVTSTVAIPTGVWTHVAARFDSSSGELSVYVNGVVRGSVISGKIPAVSGVGPMWTRASMGLAGMIDEVTIYGVALSNSDIAKMQTGVGSLLGSSIVPECYYRFDDGTNPLGTSGNPAWHYGQVQEFASGYENDWMTGWRNAGSLTGGATMVLAPSNAPVLYALMDVDNDGLPDGWESEHNITGGASSAFEDPDADGLANIWECLAGTNPNLWDTDGDGFSDYDSRNGPGARTWGERYDDGDGIPDLWELQYKGPCATTGKRGLDPSYYDANLDPDEDGWDNYSEYLASTDPLDAYIYPDPLVAIRVRYHGRWGSSVPEAMMDDNITHGGSSLLEAGSWPDADELQAVCYAPMTHLVGSLQNGDVSPGTVHFRIGDYIPVVMNGFTNYVARSTSIDMYDDMHGHLSSTGTLNGVNVSGYIDYSSGGWSLNFSSPGVTSYAEIFAGYKYWYGGQLKLSFYKTSSMDGWPTATLKMDSEYQEARVFTSGHLWQGNNYVFCYMDRNANNKWEPDLEPAGIGQFGPVNVGWGVVNNIEIGLTDSMPGYPRFAWTHDPSASRYVITNMAGKAFGRIIEAGSEWDEDGHHWVGGPRNYWHEGDWLYAGMYGYTNAAYAIQVYTNAMYGSYTNFAGIASALTVGAPSISTPNGSLAFQYAKNEIEFDVDANASAYMLQIATSSNGTPILAVTNIVPFMDINGVRKITVPFYAGDNYGVNGGYASNQWANGLYWARVWALTPGSNKASSPWSSFIVDIQSPAVGGKSMISGDVYYFGKVGHGYGSGQASNLTIIVQAFQSPGFSGTADGQVQISYQCNTNSPSTKKGSYSLMGLRSVPYYVRAFIDENGNRQLDSWEPMGFAQQVTRNGYEAIAIDLTGEGSSAQANVRIIIRDRDTDDDALPDGWEWMYYGSLANGSSNIAVNGMTLLRNYEIEPMDLDPTLLDYDFDGASDVDEITYSDRLAGRSPDVNHYDPFDPVSNPSGTDLNPTKWDTDGDGLSDGYELAHGLNPLDRADGAAKILSALAAGETIPGIPAVSRIAAVTPDGGQFSLSWTGQVGMSYEVQVSDDLKNWQAASGGARYGAALHTYVDQSPKVTTRFYRVVVK